MPVNHISQDVQRILSLQTDLLQDPLKTPLVAVDIGKHIMHSYFTL